MLNTLKSAALALVCALAATAAIAATPTTHYSLQKPQVGADSDQWGTLVNGDLDTIDSTMFGISGVANAAMPKAGGAYTGKVSWAAAVAGAASANCPNGAAPTSPATGDLWCVGGQPRYFDGVTTHTLAFTDSSITGNAATATTATNANHANNADAANALQNSQVFSAGGDVNCPGVSFNGTGGVALSCSLAGTGGGFSGGDATHVVGMTVDTKGRVLSAASVLITPDTCGTNGNGSYCKNAEGYVHEWGSTASLSGGAAVTITLPFACPSSLPIVNTTPQSGGTNGGSALPLSTSQFSLTNNKSSASNYNWAADCN